MKLRRAMAVAAATAVIAPVALLSAPAAFATDGDTPTTTTSSPAADESTPAADESTPAADESTPAADESTPAADESTPAADESTPAADESTPAADQSSPAASTSPSPSASESGEPEEPDVPFCEELDGDYSNAKVSADIKGLPGKIVAGDGFHQFTLSVTNQSKADIDGVAFYAEIENYELDESKYLSPYVNLQFKNPETGSWDRIGNAEWAGDYFFFVPELKAKATESVKLRVSIDAKAPAGDAYSFGSGAYIDNVKGQDCIAEGWAQYDFQVLKPGTSNPNPGDAKPSDNGTKESVKKPQGDVSALPTGNLAETGSSSALPVIGLVGGVAVVAGAGAMFVVRRRKAGVQA
ncbi:LAETG motif-containing sortase-dependent surface protein [Streptomyces griseosporeus]|uniref:LAETG motif-containing sortase-dependent surface protein n=1 Tax=Streptomyces griseosporeus TaxID=1910 RepID=UPI0036F9A053